MTLRILLVLTLIAISTSVAAADEHRIPLAGSTSELTPVAEGRDGLTFRVAVGELTGLDVGTPAGDFTRLLIPGFHATKTVGAPELPMMNRLIAVPVGARTRIEILSSRSRTIDLADFGITNRLMPAQESMPKNADPATWPFRYEPASYEVDRAGQELVSVVPTGRLRGLDLGRVEVSPVEYFPRTNQIRVTEEIEFRVIFENADLAATDALYAATYSPFFLPVYGQVAGFRGLHDSYPDRVRDIVTMVIVTPPELESTLAGFVDWKTERGIHVIVGVRGTPEVGTTADQIKTWVQGLYNSPPPGVPAPSFVLFVGDVEQMPTFTLGGNATDRPYCAVDADLVPDMYYGRFSATNPSQLQAIIDKTLMYDQFTMPDPSYLGEVVMIAGMDGSFGQVWANGQINYGTSLYFNAAHGILSHTYLYPQSGGQAAAIVQNVSDGVAYVNYTAHGSQTSWSDPSFTQSNVNSLQNAGEYCLAVGNCCLTSSYQVPECFAETWLRAPNKGAIGYIGGSNNTYWDEDYWWGVGYGQIVEFPVYQGHGLGAYDGVFHDHGEAMTQWYVTNDALIFCGNLAVMEAGSSRTEYYWNIYNLMGDPSLSTYLGVPSANPVTHPATLFTNTTTVAVTAVPGSYVGLTQGGEIFGAGTVDESGSLSLTLSQLLIPGSARLVVTAQNREPFITDLNVIVPAVVTLDPSAIQANVTTPVTVGVYEADGSTPRPGIEVWAEGLDYSTPHSVTGANGLCVVTINYPYGPSLEIVGKDPADPWELFRTDLEVIALPLTDPDLYVTTSIGLNDAFPLNLPGVLHAEVSQPGHTLWAFVNDDPGVSTSGTTLTLTPHELGEVRGVIAVSGYDLHEETFPIIEAFGTLAGHVSSGATPVSGALVRGYDTDGGLAFQATTNASGDYAMPDPILVDQYTIKVDRFGYLHWEEPYFLNYGDNVLSIELDPAPSGVLSGTVTETGTGAPLAATVKLYRFDTNELVAETATDPATGAYTSPPVPYFEYMVKVRAFRHIPVTLPITIEEPVTEKHFVLDPTAGDLLVIDDTAKAGERPAKVEEKTGVVLAAGSVAVEDDKTVAEIQADLEELGYAVTVETMGTTNPATWPDYDLLLVCSGSNITTLNDAIFRTALQNYVTAGGHLLIEGGEVGYDHYTNTAFASTVLHISAWNHDQSGNVTVAAPAHHVVSVPNVIAGPITMTYVGYGDEDALVQTPDAVMVGSWSTYPGDASIITYDPNPAPEGGQFVFFAFNYGAMDANVRPQLLENAVLWLITPEAGTSAVSGRVTLDGESDHSGVRVAAIPNGGFVITGTSGEYTLPGLFAGDYQIIATKDGWSTGLEEVSLTEGQHMTGVDFTLTPVTETTLCRQPHLAIPDNNPVGVTDRMPVAIGGTITALEVHLDITHTYIGDLQVTLTSPRGTSVMLHNRSGGTTDNIHCWYPTEVEPAQSLDAFIGQPTDGEWALHVADLAGVDTGTLNEWCLRFRYGSTTGVDASGAPLPAEVALGANVPNPFNPATRIDFALPEAGAIDLAVFDVSGRRVATVASGPWAAGLHHVIWHGRDANGRTVASGLYFYRLDADGRTLTRRMLLLK